ncbi:hypothetical protein Ciccas_010582 [Cichlidogyrus casuarinus]|uniref:Uncharacterized protein n=1 Tax=Cichlidogyrus casuarinus TaxID=1844966 RepID=A0ABD2PTR8_9PLAT
MNYKITTTLSSVMMYQISQSSSEDNHKVEYNTVFEDPKPISGQHGLESELNCCVEGVSS